MSPIRKPVCRGRRIVASRRSWLPFFSPSRVRIRSIAPIRSARSCLVVGSAGGSSADGASAFSRIGFYPKLRNNPCKKRFHSFQALEIRDWRATSMTHGKREHGDAELLNLDDALLFTEFFQQIRELAILLEGARRGLHAVRSFTNCPITCSAVGGASVAARLSRKERRLSCRHLPFPLDFLGLGHLTSPVTFRMNPSSRRVPSAWMLADAYHDRHFPPAHGERLN